MRRRPRLVLGRPPRGLWMEQYTEHLSQQPASTQGRPLGRRLVLVKDPASAYRAVWLTLGFPVIWGGSADVMSGWNDSHISPQGSSRSGFFTILGHMAVDWAFQPGCRHPNILDQRRGHIVAFPDLLALVLTSLDLLPNVKFVVMLLLIQGGLLGSFFKNWSVVDLQNWVSFWCPAEWFSYTCMFVCVCV